MNSTTEQHHYNADRNYVGELQEYLVKHYATEPRNIVYTYNGANGMHQFSLVIHGNKLIPPCTGAVSHVSKAQAKQSAACVMLEYIIEVYPILCDAATSSPEDAHSTRSRTVPQSERILLSPVNFTSKTTNRTPRSLSHTDRTTALATPLPLTRDDSTLPARPETPPLFAHDTDGPCSITLICGPMFAGKTNEMMRLVRRHRYAKRKCIVFKHSCDTRYGGYASIKSHDGVALDAMAVDSLQYAEDTLRKAEQWDSLTVIAVDEGQFFGDLITKVVEWAEDQSKIVIVSALDKDFRRNSFGDVVRLVAHATSVVKLPSICRRCGADAYETRLKAGYLNTSSGKKINRIHVGGDTEYEAVCLRCFKQLM